jgi:hypothetical protein
MRTRPNKSLEPTAPVLKHSWVIGCTRLKLVVKLSLLLPRLSEGLVNFVARRHQFSAVSLNSRDEVLSAESHKVRGSQRT